MASLSEDINRLEIGVSDSLDPAKAIVICTRMLKIHPSRDNSYSNWALQLLKQGQCQKAKQKFKRSPKFFHPDWTNVQNFWIGFSSPVLQVFVHELKSKERFGKKKRGQFSP